ncbi:MAG TPA: pitrilysin family protein [Bacteroidota bacterium]|nr:pitrilysin family protein [Bacteroidota bacterium]
MNRIQIFIILTLAAMALTTTLSAPDESGLKFTQLQSSNSPLVTFRIILRRGAVDDPKGKEGLNGLTATLIAEGGTRELTYPQVVDKLYPWAAGIDVQRDDEITTFIGNVHRDHLDEFYNLFAGLLLRPRFDPADFQRVKDLGLNYLKNTLRGTNDESLGKQALNAFIFDGTPYGKPEGGTVQGLTAITLEDVKDYYSKNYTQANLWIGIAGGYPQTLADRIRADFSVLPAGTHAEVSLTKPSDIKGMEVMVVEKPTRAYAVSMGYLIDLTRNAKDFYALLVANSYFGEHRTFNGVLMNRLRGDRGLNYGDYSYIEKFVGGLGSGNTFPDLNTPRRQQCFSIWLRPVQPENTHFAIRNALYELKRLVENGISESDFQQTRKFVINYSKLWASTLSRRLGYLMDSEFYGSDYYIDRIERELKALTADDVNASIRKYLHPNNIKIAVVVDEGKGQEFYSALSANTPSPIKYQSPVSQKILDEDKLISVFPLTVNKERSKVVGAKDLFEK